jgi:hypothetical protein
VADQMIVRERLKAYEIGALLFQIYLLLHFRNETIITDSVFSQQAYINAQRHFDSLSNSLESFSVGIPSFDDFQQDDSTASRRVTDDFLARYPDLKDFLRFGRISSALIHSLHLPDTSGIDREMCDICVRNGVDIAVTEGLLQRRRAIDPSVLQTEFDKICNNMANQNDNTTNPRIIHATTYIETNDGVGVINIHMNEDLTSLAAQIQSSIDCLQQQGKPPEEAQAEVAQDIATQAQNDPIIKEKLIKWGQSIGTATVTDVVKGAVKLAIRLAGIPIP